MMVLRNGAAVVCATFVLAGTACGDSERAADDRAELGAPHAAPVSDAALAQADGDASMLDTTSEPGALGGVSAATVDLWKGPGDRPFEVTLRTADPVTALVRRFGTVSMRTALRARTPDLDQYPCTSCHLGRRMILADDRVADAHQNIRAIHPVQTGGTCSTCHSPDNVELLALRSGESATLDHTYRLCAQCHFAQADAWAGGAHGKRLDGWQGRRVLMGCADCHDPHNPVLEPRIPFRAPRIERTRGGGQ